MLRMSFFLSGTGLPRSTNSLSAQLQVPSPAPLGLRTIRALRRRRCPRANKFHCFLLNLAIAFYNVGTTWAHEVDILSVRWPGLSRAPSTLNRRRILSKDPVRECNGFVRWDTGAHTEVARQF